MYMYTVRRTSPVMSYIGIHYHFVLSSYVCHDVRSRAGSRACVVVAYACSLSQSPNLVLQVFESMLRRPLIEALGHVISSHLYVFSPSDFKG